LREEQGDLDAKLIYRAVLLQAANDALRGSGKIGSDAREWFREGNEDFIQTCKFAGYVPAAILKGMEKRINGYAN
jgi:hypothetical protein